MHDDKVRKQVNSINSCHYIIIHENNFPLKTLETRIELLLHSAIDTKDFQELIFAHRAACPWMRPVCLKGPGHSDRCWVGITFLLHPLDPVFIKQFIKGVGFHLFFFPLKFICRARVSIFLFYKTSSQYAGS